MTEFHNASERDACAEEPPSFGAPLLWKWCVALFSAEASQWLESPQSTSEEEPWNPPTLCEQCP